MNDAQLKQVDKSLSFALMDWQGIFFLRSNWIKYCKHNYRKEICCVDVVFVSSFIDFGFIWFDAANGPTGKKNETQTKIIIENERNFRANQNEFISWTYCWCWFIILRFSVWLKSCLSSHSYARTANWVYAVHMEYGIRNESRGKTAIIHVTLDIFGSV